MPDFESSRNKREELLSYRNPVNSNEEKCLVRGYASVENSTYVFEKNKLGIHSFSRERLQDCIYIQIASVVYKTAPDVPWFSPDLFRYVRAAG